jgi:hypothetical protein
MPPHRLTSVLITLAVLACGGGGGEAGPQPVDPCAVTPLAVALSIADARADAAPGTVDGAITGDFPRTLGGRASGFSRTLFPAFLVVDAFAVDGAGRPNGELFVFAPGTPTVGTRQLVPVTLEQVQDPSFIPTGPIAVWAEAFDPNVGDYTRWLLADAGTLGITSVPAAEVGRVGLTVSLNGAWRTGAGTRLGCGRIVGATIDAPVVRGTSPTSALVDTVEATTTGNRAETLGSQTIDAFQTLAANDTRLLFVATIPGDSTRELWLSLNGMRLTADSVPLGELSLEGARAGRDTGSFAMLRVMTVSGTTPIVAQVWRSTSGWVKLTNLVPGAPLILCGWGTARFSFTAAGHDNATGAPIGTLAVSGALEARYTVLSRADSLVDLSASRATGIRLNAPESARNRRCFL